MNELKEFTDKFNLDNPDPCWWYLEEMKPWQGETPCKPNPGQRCPACGKHWDKRLKTR